MGGFNIDILVDTDETHVWLEMMEDYNLSQLTEEPTRVTDNTSTLVDHVYMSAPH